MTFRMRRAPRKTIDRPAWISTGKDEPLRNCRLVDISDCGAKLAIDDDDGLPDSFNLWLSRHGKPSYSCRIVWNRLGVIGVEFRPTADNQREPAMGAPGD
jgi:hypothetical protein